MRLWLALFLALVQLYLEICSAAVLKTSSLTLDSNRVKRQTTHTDGEWETTSSGGGEWSESGGSSSVSGYSYEEVPAGYEYEESFTYEEDSHGGGGAAAYGYNYGYGYGHGGGGAAWKKKQMMKHKKKKMMKKKKKKMMKKKKKKMMKKKKKKVVKKKRKPKPAPKPAPTTTTTTTTPAPAPACPPPAPTYQYIPIMEYVSQPRVESVPVVTERLVHGAAQQGYAGYGWGGYGQVSPLGMESAYGMGTGSRRYYMLRRQDGADGLGQMGLGQLSGYLQGQLGLNGVRTLGGSWGNGGSGWGSHTHSYSPASSWNTGLTRTIQGWGRNWKNKVTKKN